LHRVTNENIEHPTSNTQHRMLRFHAVVSLDVQCWMLVVGCSKMMIFKSIKWRLQLWYGLILVLVLAGFGVTAYQLEWGRQMRQVDDELQRRFGIVADALRPPHRRPEFRGQPFGQPPPDQFPGEMPPGQNPRLPPELHLPPIAVQLFDTNDSNGFYFVIQSRDGKEIARGGEVPKHVASEFARLSELLPPVDFRPSETAVSPPTPLPVREEVLMTHSITIRSVSRAGHNPFDFREIIRSLPSGETVLVGCPVTRQLTELHRTALEYSAAGGIILLLGLAGGWWLVGRALQPINNISATAARISAGDLSQRIDVAETESELGRLAAVLNSTFARLDAAFAQQQQFTADAAHELRTPVSVILTQTQTALSRERAAAEYRETVEACERSAQRMRRLIESLLELARLDAGQETMKRLRFDLATTVNDCTKQVQQIAGQRNVKLSTRLAPVEITGDAERLAQVITNLLVNAVQYNRPDGEVRVKLEPQPGLAILTVTDTGPGISAEDLPHVFERFYRGDKSRTASNGNAGLGLAISKAIVEAHGGTIEVSSQTGRGTIFTLRLPVT
jgi:signal transduction histidine kinase